MVDTQAGTRPSMTTVLYMLWLKPVLFILFTLGSFSKKNSLSLVWINQSTETDCSLANQNYF